MDWNALIKKGEEMRLEDSGQHDYRKECRNAGMQECRSAGRTECRKAGLQACPQYARQNL
jgi:hypothetical protein